MPVARALRGPVHDVRGTSALHRPERSGDPGGETGAPKGQMRGLGGLHNHSISMAIYQLVVDIYKFPKLFAPVF